VQAGESYLGCHIHVDILVSRASQPEADSLTLFKKTRKKKIFLKRVLKRGVPWQVTAVSSAFGGYIFAQICKLRKICALALGGQSGFETKREKALVVEINSEENDTWRRSRSREPYRLCCLVVGPLNFCTIGPVRRKRLVRRERP
jgi:hypothetical protein